METRLSITKIWSGLVTRLAGSGFQCVLLSVLAFLPIGGLALLSPKQIEAEGTPEFVLAALLISRLLTPPVAALIVAYLARREGRIDQELSLWAYFRRHLFASTGLVLGVSLFGLFASLFLIVPGIAFWLAGCLVLPVLVVEGVSSPHAVKRSWEISAEHRWALFGFWSQFLSLCAVVFGLVWWTAPVGWELATEPLPFVQTDAFLPTVFLGSSLYAAMVMATYEIYAQLVPGTTEP